MFGRNLAHPVKGVSFSLFSDDDIRALSAKAITTAQVFSELGQPVIGGLYDPALGPTEHGVLCPTCGLSYSDCPGHIGRIELCVPVYNPLLLPQMFKLLRMKCFKCHQFRLAAMKVRIVAAKLQLVLAGRIEDAVHLDGQLTKLAQSATDPESHAASLDLLLKEIEQDCKLRGAQKTMSTHAREHFALLVKQFMGSMPPRACQNCQAVSVQLRKDGFSKIFKKRLSDKARRAMHSLGLYPFTSALDTLTGSATLNPARVTSNVSETTPVDSGASSADSDEEVENVNEIWQFMPASEVEAQIRLLWQQEMGIMKLLLAGTVPSSSSVPFGGAAAFFLRVLPVTASRFRPPTVLGDLTFEHPQVTYYKQIVNYNAELSKFTDPSAVESNPSRELSRALSTWIELQNSVNTLIDSTKTTQAGVEVPPGIRQLLEKKEGMFRKYMMGKRVNYAARSVISPDPYIRPDQIGVPVRFAKTLTYPQPVNHWNADYLRKLVINGAEHYPGANYFEDEMGRKVDLRFMNPKQRESIAKALVTPSPGAATGAHPQTGARGPGVKRVWRHLQDDDMLLVNRQPSLHKPSIMAHRARILLAPSHQTIRMHYANCNTYNADFDGDEMNLHFPQDELARADGYTIAATPHQYLVPTSGKPLRGLIQDHVGVGVLLTIKNTFLTRDQFHQLVYSAARGLPAYQKCPNKRIPFPPPTIFAPKRLWTGKQVISALLDALTIDLPDHARKLTMNGTPKVSAQALGLSGSAKAMPGDHTVIIRQNELLAGVLDKSQFGATEFGLVHSVYELFGPLSAGALLSAFSRLFTTYLQWSAVTCGVEDLVLLPTAEKARTGLIAEANMKGFDASAAFAELSESAAIPAKKCAMVRQQLRERLCAGEATVPDAAAAMSGRLDQFMKKAVTDCHTAIIKSCLPDGQLKSFPENRFSLMIFTGAKGSLVNHSMISCGLGQQELEGKRVPMMISGKTLPSFPAYDPSPRAGGYIADRFLTGLRPQDYYFHCMSGREGLVDTAVKTSRSGYLQRCLVKHLEDLHVAYDNTVRDADGSVIQFLYGEDGIDPVNSKFLQGEDKQLSFLASNIDVLTHQYKLASHQFSAAGLDLHTAESQHQAIAATKAVVAGQRAVNDALQPGSEVKVCVAAQERSCKFGPELLTSTWQRGMISRQRCSKSGTVVGFDVQIGSSSIRKVPILFNGVVTVIPVIPDPVQSVCNISTCIGAISEALQARVEDYMKRDPEQMFNSPDLSISSFVLLVWVKFMRSMAAAGEPVGVVAAQSVGEPSTQMTLNTFHLAGHGGVNVTLGIPRLREIVMTASQNIKTPMMTLYGKQDATKQDLQQIARKLARLSLAEVLDLARPNGGLEVHEVLRPSINNLGHNGAYCNWMREYRVRLYTLPSKALKSVLRLSLDQLAIDVGEVFIPQLLTVLAREFRRAGLSAGAAGVAAAAETMQSQTSDKQAANEAEDQEPSRQEFTYDNMDDAKSDTQSDDGESDTEKSPAPVADGDGDEDDALDSAAKLTGESDERGATRIKVPPSVARHKRFQALLLYKSESCIEIQLTFPASFRKVLMQDAAEEALNSALLRSTKGIARCVVSSKRNDNGKQEPVIEVEGINFGATWHHGQYLELGRTSTNDIGAILQTYGVEAARQAIVKEVKGVFGVYGIAVDMRHLGLIADYMTFGGGYRALNRVGITAKGSSLQKMSFETTTKFLTDACTSGTADLMGSPSAQIVTGNVVRVGSGLCDVLTPVQ